MTNPPTDEMVEAAARAIFIARKPKNMIPADWDSGALLGGRDDSYRHAILNQARAALEAALSHQGGVVKCIDYPECSGDANSCPENEGYGCCKDGQ